MSHIRYTVADAVARIVLDSPQTRNALSNELLDELILALGRARDDDDVHVVVLESAHERVFSAGGDLKAFAGDQPTMEKYRSLDRFPVLYQMMPALGKPIICAAGGDVLAGAFGLALSCDFIIAKEFVRFGCPEINVGVFPFMISALIFRNVPRMVANQLMMMGDSLSAAEAKDLGIVNAVVSDEEFATVVDEWAARLAAKSPLLMRMGKDALGTVRDMALPESLAAMQAQLGLALSTEDVKEGVAAFREKRDPQWRLR